MPDPVISFTIGCISMGIGIFFGCLAGLFLFLFAKQENDEHFHDFTYWVNDDGISYPFVNEKKSMETSMTFNRIIESNKDIKRKHAYT